MKKILGISIVLLVVAILLQNEIDKPKQKENLLEANLLAALSLENKFISTCGELKYDYRPLKSKAPLLEGLGDHTFSITTTNDEAQIYFNQGINLVYAFNHTEAHRSFKEAANLSPESPLTYWGQAYALSPNINDRELDDQRKQEAYEAIQMAILRIKNGNKLEKALINALSKRFVMMEDSTIQVDNEQYMEEMKEVASKFPKNPDVLTLYAASIMNTMPWAYWNRDMTPRPNTREGQEALKNAIAIDPKHPGAHHYNIHLIELPFPEHAAVSGDVLAGLMPGAGHMVHMPSHAYIRVGRYRDAAESNLKAIAADESYISQCYSQGIYPLGYYPHNIHFLWSAATFLGDSKTAITAARKTAEKVSVGQLEQLHFMQEFAAIPLQSYVKFGQWNEILTVPDPGDNLKHLKIFWHYGRGMAFIRKGILTEAQEEVDALGTIRKDSTYATLFATINNSQHIAEIAFNLVQAELAAASQETEAAKKYFEKAVMFEDSLIYTEPPSWHMSTRLNYGKFLVDQKDFKAAVDVFKADITKWGKNGWSLTGLHNAYLGSNDEANANLTRIELERAWQYADITIGRAVL